MSMLSCELCVVCYLAVAGARARAVGCGVLPIATIRAANRLVGGRIACIRGPGCLSEHRGPRPSRDAASEGEDFIGSVLQKADAASFYAEP